MPSILAVLAGFIFCLAYEGECRDPCSVRHRFKCADGTCVPVARICDGKNDCPGGEDESYAHAGCDQTTACKPRNQALLQESGYLCRRPCNGTCSAANKRCVCDDECGYSCINPDGECPPVLPTIPHTVGQAVIRFENGFRYSVTSGPPYVHGDMIRYECESGRFLVGPLPRCDGRKQWTKERPECVVDHCAVHPCHNGGTCVNRLHDSVCFCDKEYEGRYCETSLADPCKDSPCENGGTCHSDGNLLSCACPEGFYGKKCSEAITCGEPPNIPNGRWSGDRIGNHSVNTVLDPICDDGYENTVEAVLVCHINGRWFQTSDLSCQKIECPTPDAPDHGYITNKKDKYEFGETATTACFNDYSLTGNSTRTCIGAWRWTPSDAECIRMVCSLDVYLLPVGIYVHGHTPEQLYYKKFSVGDLATVFCSSVTVPYAGDSPLTPSVLRCEVGGRWSPRYKDLYCGPRPEATCPFPDLPAHMVLTDRPSDPSYSVGTRLGLGCTAGKRITGDSFIECQGDGSWTKTGGCEMMRCELNNASLAVGVRASVIPGSLRNEDGSFVFGEVVNLSCDDPRKQPFSVADQTLTNATVCFEEEMWLPSLEDIHCVSVCGKPPLEDNGMLVLDDQGELFYENKSVLAICPPTFRLVGSNLLHCQSDGSWSRGDGCEPMGCRVDLDYLHNSVVIEGHSNKTLEGVEFATNTTLSIGCLDPNHVIESDLSRTISCIGQNIWSPDYRQYRCELKDLMTCRGRCQSAEGPCACDFECDVRDDCCEDFVFECLK